MTLERIEEILLIIVAIGMLSYLGPEYLIMPVTLLIALLLIAVLILRSVAWHRDGITPFDGIMVIGISVTVAYLASFGMVARNPLNALVLLLFASFYSLMAVMLFSHRTKPVHSAHPRVKHLRVWKVVPKRTPSRAEFKKGIEPIPERPPRWYRRVFTRRDEHMVRASHVEPLAERPPRWYNRTLVQGTAHTAAPRRAEFHAGMEPIPEITPEHLHRLGVYESEPRRRR